MSIKFRLRKARLSDCRRIWYWRNEKEVRRLSLSNQKIPYRQHKSWFENKIKDPHTLILIAEIPFSQPIGQVRLDSLTKHTGEIHITVRKSSRNQGLGQILLSKTCQYGFGKLGLNQILATVLTQNRRSVSIFKKIGFKIRTWRKVTNRRAIVMVLSKSNLKT